MNQPDREKSPASLRWLSEDYAVLRRKPRRQVWDVLVVGSGYGGSMAAAEFAGLHKPDGSKVTVCVLERGKEYAPGMFPSSMQELPTNVRINAGGAHRTMGRFEGLLDIRVGEDVCAILGNGLGGTSLINAGVMVAPKLQPGQLPDALARALTPQYFAEVKQMLAASDTLLQDHPALARRPLRKNEELRRVARRNGAAYEDAAITVQTKAGNPDIPQCTLCGDCMTGCNVGAKRSLDTTLLARAWGKGAEIYTGASVLRVRRGNDDTWLVQATFTNESLRSRHRPRTIRARKVVLAAGTLGSTEILLRSQRSGMDLSPMLGQRFSCNGDNLVAVHEGEHDVHSGENEWQPLDQRHVGPTITGIVRKPGFLVQEFAVPGPLKRFFEETVTTSRLLHSLSEAPWPTESQKRQGLDTAAVNPEAMEKTLLVGVIGHDDSNWRIKLRDKPRHPDQWRPTLEGQVEIVHGATKKGGSSGKDDNAPQDSRMQRDYEAVREMLQQASPRAAVLPNPLWKLLPDELMNLVPGARGPVLTVHPLGGCPMGTSHVNGVVDQLGQVFRTRPRRGSPSMVHEGLVVLDGSIIPGSLAANPALTIAAIARHAAHALAAQWRWRAANIPVQVPVNRPVYRPIADCTPKKPVPTKVELIERLAGPVGRHWVELTVAYQPTQLTDLCNQASRTFIVNENESYIRVYEGGPTARTDYLLLKEHERDRRAKFKAPLTGSLVIVEPDLSAAKLRLIWGAFRAWWLNRGKRELGDQYQYWRNRLLGRPVDEVPASVNWLRFPESSARAGQQRRFDYQLTVGAADPKQPAPGAAYAPLAGIGLEGTKRVTYSRRCNPWRQLTELSLSGFPGVPEPSTLKLDGRFLAGRGVPLLRVREQQNQVVALADFASLGLAWARMLVSIHLWSFRAPDRPEKRDAPVRQTLPGAEHVTELLPREIHGLPAPQRTWLDLQPELRGPRTATPYKPARQTRKVQALLTRYPHPGSTKPPIVLIHGYSASGSTFTHHSIPMPLAKYLWLDQRDVWVLDLRTSCGITTSLRPWAFEDAALADIPCAIDHIARETGQQVDVFAHCIGAVMLSMALLTDNTSLPRFKQVDVKPWETRPKRWGRQLQRLRGNIRRIVLSQKGPLLVYSDANVLRAYVMRLLRKVLLPENYQFRPKDPGAIDNLMDRLLSTMVYPDDEFDLENPYHWTDRARWGGFRHRMDALYARDFSLANIDPKTLRWIDELFGPLNLETVSQAIHFARKNVITDINGIRFDATRPALAALWPKGGTLSIHGVENGLADVKTLEVMQSAMRYANVPYEALPICGYGHQDCLIGRNAEKDVFSHITTFLDQPVAAMPVQPIRIICPPEPGPRRPPQPPGEADWRPTP